MVQKSKRFQEAALSHFNALYNFALKTTNNVRDAEDLLQETCLRAYRKFDQFDFGTNCKAWLFKIMRNIAIDQIRKKDPLLTQDINDFEEEFYMEDLPRHLPLKSIDMKTAFELLPEKYKIPVLLKDIEGFTYKEIAEILNFPIGTVMSRLYRGRTELKSLLSIEKPVEIGKKILELKK